MVRCFSVAPWIPACAGNCGEVWGQNQFIPTPLRLSHTTAIPSPDRAVRTDRVVMVFAALAPAGKTPAGSQQSGRACGWQQCRAQVECEEDRCCRQGVTPLPIGGAASCGLRSAAGRPVAVTIPRRAGSGTPERPTLRRARPERSLYSHAERLALPLSVRSGRARPCH